MPPLFVQIMSVLDDDDKDKSNSNSQINAENSKSNQPFLVSSVTQKNAPASTITIFRSFETALSDSVFGLCNGLLYGAVWGMVTPFAPFVVQNSDAVKSAVSSKFPIRPFSSPKAMYQNSLLVGGLAFVWSLSTASIALIRRKQDGYNNLFGLSVSVGYSRFFLHSNARLLLHNRVVGGTICGGILISSIWS